MIAPSIPHSKSKFLAVAMICMASLLITSECPAQTSSDDAAALEKARVLFPEFRDSVYTDQDKAKKAYDSLLELSPVIQKRLLVWLDEQYGLKKAAYYNESPRTRNSNPSSGRAGDAEKIEEYRSQLSSIREIKDENEMKKTLKDSGLKVLKQLMKLSKSRVRSYDELSVVEPNPVREKAALKQVQQVGEFRYQLRKNLIMPVVKVEDDIQGSGEGGNNKGQATALQMDRKYASVLAKNKTLKSEIPRGEYAGILELNHWRIAAGMAPLLIDPKLCDAARDHSKDMAEKGFFAHESPVKGKKTPWDRAKRFNTTAKGENIAINSSPEESNQAWFLSPGHHKNMFKSGFSVMGLGIKGRHYTQLFR
jgi:hypothetical protein